MSNFVIALFVAISALALYFSRSNRFSFLLIVAAAALIAYRSGFVFISAKFIILLAALGFLFWGAGRIFKKTAVVFSYIATSVVFILTLIRIC